MLIQVSSPRMIFHPETHPQHVFIQTLRKRGVSEGEVYFNASTDPLEGVRQTKALEPIQEYPIDGDANFAGLEYVLPFYELFTEETKKKNLYLVPFCTTGFNVTVKSAFRADPRTYEERTVALSILMPVTGGGIIRIGDSLVDLANPTFDPYAPLGRTFRDLSLQEGFNRTHRLPTPAIDARRQARVAAAEASMAKERTLPAREVPTLPGRRGIKALPPKDDDE